MPIYEFYCSHCHTLFNFFSATVDTTTCPECPRCKRSGLERRPARFATLQHQGESDALGLEGLDEERFAGVMESMAQELGGLEETEDPRLLASLFRRFGEAAGLELGPRMREMMARLEAGENLDELEEEMEGELDEGDSLEDFFRFKNRARRLARQPAVDGTLYFL
jgi:putative FmdB family regulatory protein